jgi:hypothetical protein
MNVYDCSRGDLFLAERFPKCTLARLAIPGQPDQIPCVVIHSSNTDQRPGDVVHLHPLTTVSRV